MKKHIFILGAGNMGSAMYRLLNKTGKYEVHIYDTNEEQLHALGCISEKGVWKQQMYKADLVIVAVKPQSFQGLVEMTEGSWGNGCILSIMAGVRLETLCSALGTSRVVRAMPNLGLAVGKSVTGWCGSGGLKEVDMCLVGEVLQEFGYAFSVEEESQLNAVTALSGSGPAYFFHMTALLQEQASAYGFSTEQAACLARETLCGSAAVLQQLEGSALEWQQRVTSKGGTTEAALRVLEKERFPKVFAKAMEAAKKRAEELS